MPLFGPSGGGVSSVGLSTSGVLHSVGGSPVTSSGTLALNLLTQTANTVLAGPTTGAAATPTMRALVAADIPAHDASLLTSGTLPLARLAGLTTTQLDAAAGITSGQIAGLAASKLSGANSLPDSVLSTNVPLLAQNNSFTTAGSAAASGTPLLFGIAPTLTQSGTAGYTGLDVNVTETSTGSGTKRLLDLRTGGTSRFSVDRTGTVTATDPSGGWNTFQYLKASTQLNATSIVCDFNTNGISMSPTSNGVIITTGAANKSALILKGAASQTSDLLACQNSAAALQFGVANTGTGGSPVWGLRVRAVANAESMVQSHTLGADTGKGIKVIDDAGATLGYLQLYN